MQGPKLVPMMLLGVLLAGCRGGDRSGADWPTLAPRAGEVTPMVPRTPLGACPGCGPDLATPAVAAAPAPLPPPPADSAARLDAVATAIAEIEEAYPAQRRTTEAAIKAATRGSIDASGEAEVQRSRLEALLLPLAVQTRTLDDLEDDLAGKAATAALLARIAELRGRIARLEAARDAV